MKKIIVKLIRSMHPDSLARTRARIRRSIREDTLRFHWRNAVELVWDHGPV